MVDRDERVLTITRALDQVDLQTVGPAGLVAQTHR